MLTEATWEPRDPTKGITIVYRGWLRPTSNGEESDLLGITEAPKSDQWRATDILAECVRDDLQEHGPYLSVRYFLTDGPVDDEALEAALATSLCGEGDAAYGMRYSEITGYLWTDEDLTVGGHDLLEELKAHIGKWLMLEITYYRTPATPDLELWDATRDLYTAAQNHVIVAESSSRTYWLQKEPKLVQQRDEALTRATARYTAAYRAVHGEDPDERTRHRVMWTRT